MIRDTLTWDGKMITAAGVYAGLPLDVYHSVAVTAAPSISSSGLRTIWGKSPAHYWAYSPYNEKRYPVKRKDEWELGRAAHHWLLGEEDFAKHFVLSPYDEFRSKEAKAWRDGIEASGRSVVTPKMMEQIAGMRDGLMRNDVVRHAGILDGAVERSFIWESEFPGIWLRARPDVVPTASGDFADLKTTTSVMYEAASKSVGDFGYGMQAALLRMGCRALGIEFTSFSLVFVEKEPPFSARAFAVKPHELDRGEREIRAALKLFKRGLETGNWPGPDGDQQDVEWIETPAWHQQRADARLAAFEATEG